MYYKMRWWFVIAFLLCSLLVLQADSAGERDKKKKKSILDYNDADVERIFREWEENDDDRDEDDDTDPFKPPSGPPLNLESFRGGDGKIDPQELMKQSKKNKPMMIFVGVKFDGGPDQHHTDKISNRWMQSLQNAHLPVQKYNVAPDRVLFMTEDGSRAWDIKDYLVTQSECTTVNFDQLSFPCADSAPASKAKTEL